MSYLMFLVVFIGPPLLLFFGYFCISKKPHKKVTLYSLLTLVVLAVSYTTPWDNYLVKTKVWWYGPDRVIGTIGYVPIEEYSFFILQTLMTGFWCYFLYSTVGYKLSAQAPSPKKRGVSLLLCSIIFLSVFGFFSGESYRYLSLILVWATPILLLQWMVGGEYLLSNLKIFLLGFMVPSAYLWVADAFAIYDKIWEISPLVTVGIKFGPLPLEEAVFFLVTNLMVVQGMMLFNIMTQVHGSLAALLSKYKKRLPFFTKVEPEVD